MTHVESGNLKAAIGKAIRSARNAKEVEQSIKRAGIDIILLSVFLRGVFAATIRYQVAGDAHVYEIACAIGME